MVTSVYTVLLFTEGNQTLLLAATQNQAVVISDLKQNENRRKKIQLIKYL